MRMAMRIRVTTRADLYEKRKQEHIERGYRIEDERPIPVNGFCYFIATREMPVSDTVDELVAQAINGGRGSHCDWRGIRCRSESDFVSMVNAACTLVMTPRATDGHSIRIVKGVNLCTSFIFTPRSRREGPRTRMASWSELRAVAKNSTPLMSPASFQTPKTSDLRLPAWWVALLRMDKFCLSS